jgi:hypothetical protein
VAPTIDWCISAFQSLASLYFFPCGFEFSVPLWMIAHSFSYFLVSVSDDLILKLSGLVGAGLKNLNSWPVYGVLRTNGVGGILVRLY